MTTVGGLFWGLDAAPAAGLGGVALPPLVAAAGPDTLDTIFRTRAPVQPGRWPAIVIHHSATGYGTPATLETRHRAQGLDGLGYHFVIGNGEGMGDGEVHVGYRWLEQLPGAHVAGANGDWYNLHSVGICLVGDGRRRTWASVKGRRLVQLVAVLQDRMGVGPEAVHLHSDLAASDDPGRFFPEAAFREQIGSAR